MKEYKNIKQDTKDTPKTEKTKMKFVEAMKECMKSKSVDSITVRMITEKCGMTRQTFYRNFLDKYDLINWYFDRILLESFERMGDGKTIYEGLVKKFRYIEEEKLFFAVAFRSDDQNSLKQHDFELILEFYCNLIAEKNGEKPSSDIMFMLEMYCRESITMTVKWVLGDIKVSDEELAKLLVRAMPRELAELFERLEILD